MIFLSTLSLRRATVSAVYPYRQTSDFYPRSPCGERPLQGHKTVLGVSISIHALLAESDGQPGIEYILCRDFYPRSPCGERQWYEKRIVKGEKFLSTLSLRRATLVGGTYSNGSDISIHALLAESDYLFHIFLISSYLFLSTLSLRRATVQLYYYLAFPLFLSTLSLRRAT